MKREENQLTKQRSTKKERGKEVIPKIQAKEGWVWGVGKRVNEEGTKRL
jgi:hypothetical protein